MTTVAAVESARCANVDFQAPGPLLEEKMWRSCGENARKPHESSGVRIDVTVGIRIEVTRAVHLRDARQS